MQDSGNATRRGKNVCGGVRSKPAGGGNVGEDHIAHQHQLSSLWHESRVCGVAGICDYGAVDRHAVWQASAEIVSDQYRLSIGVLLGDGSDCGGVAAVGRVREYPPVEKRPSAMLRAGCGWGIRRYLLFD